MKPTRRVTKAIRGAHNLSKSPEMVAWMGDGQGNTNTTDKGYSYVTMWNGQVIVVRNTKAPAIPWLPVVIGFTDENPHQQEVLRILGAYNEIPYPEVPTHATSHQWPNWDLLWVRQEQFLPGLPVPGTGLAILVYGMWFNLEGTVHHMNNTPIDISGEVVASGAEWVNVEIDASKVITFNHGTNVANRALLTPELIPTTVSTKKLLCSVMMYVGQSQVIKNDTTSDIYDPRFSGMSSSGGSGGGTPGGSDTNIQYNKVGAFAGTAPFAYIEAYNLLRMGAEIPDFEAVLDKNAILQVGDGTSHGNFQFVFSDDLTDSGFDSVIRAGGTKDSPTPVMDGMAIRRWRGRGWYQSGTSASNATGTQVEILAVADGDWSPGVYPTRIEMYTNNGTSVEQLALTIKSNGYPNLPAGRQYQVNDAQHTHAAADVSGITPADGWIASTATWTYSSTDDPTGVLIVNDNLTTGVNALGIGDKIRFVNGGNTIYGKISKAPTYSSPNTTITFLHQIDPTDNLALVLMANSAITVPYFSHANTPFGFPAALSNWTWVFTDGTDRQQNGALINTWYNPGSLSFYPPLGIWRAYTNITLQSMSAGVMTIQRTITTTDLSETISRLTAVFTPTAQYGALSTVALATLTYTSKTQHFVNIRNLSGTNDIREANSSSALVVEFVFAL